MPSNGTMASRTTAGPLAVNTPFVPPQTCVDQFETTSFTTTLYRTGSDNELITSLTTLSLLASGPADSCFSTCQPSGRDESADFTFRPVVCPAEWTAYDMHPVTIREHSQTVAYCCSSGFTLSYLLGSLVAGIASQACIQDFGWVPTTPASSTRTTTSTTTSSTPPVGVRAHNPWKIYWQPSDVASLTPAPPRFARSYSTLDTWMPDSTVSSTATAACAISSSSEHHSDNSYLCFVYIGIPLIVLALVGASVGVYCDLRTKERRDLKRRVRETEKPLGLAGLGRWATGEALEDL